MFRVSGAFNGVSDIAVKSNRLANSWRSSSYLLFRQSFATQSITFAGRLLAIDAAMNQLISIVTTISNGRAPEDQSRGPGDGVARRTDCGRWGEGANRLREIGGGGERMVARGSCRLRNIMFEMGRQADDGSGPGALYWRSGILRSITCKI